MLIEVMKDLQAFLILLIYSCIAYSFVFFTLRDEKSLSKALSSAFLLTLGSFDFSDFSIMIWIMFLMGTLINLVVMMNLLIAVISDTFERV